MQRQESNLWSHLLGVPFFVVTLALGTLAVARNQGWLTPSDWVEGVVSAYQQITKSITSLLTRLINLDSFEVSQVESDFSWLVAVLTMVWFSYRSARDPEGAIYTFRSRWFGVALFVAALLLSVLYFGFATTAEMPEEIAALFPAVLFLPILAFGTSELFLPQRQRSLVKMLIGALASYSNFLAAGLIIWCLYLTGFVAL